MRKFGWLILFVLLAALAGCRHGTRLLHDETPGDPTASRIYRLDNGLSVYLGRSPDAPRAYAIIGVKSGSAAEPADSTGLAHYLEHLLFKGTDRIAALDYADEKPLLDRIGELYEEHRRETDPERRAVLYREIDRLAGEAAQYSSADEYGRLTRSIGAAGTNAFTSWDLTAYVNDIPVNELDKFLAIEAERFRNPVFRRFHTELETVYEEFNRSQDQDSSRAFYRLLGELFPRHPYGRPIIGTAADLKNPSIRNLYDFYRDHYVPGNMAVIIVGDIDYDETLALIERHFGGFAPAEAPEYRPAAEAPFAQDVEAEVAGPDPETVLIGYRLDNTPDNRRKLILADAMLSYRDVGSLEVLTRAGVVQGAGSGPLLLNDYLMLYLSGQPRPDQSLEELRDLMVNCVDMLRRGEFEDWQLEAIVNNLYYDQLISLEGRAEGARWLLDCFSSGVTPEEEIAEYQAMREITREELIAFLNSELPAAKVTVYKTEGVPELVAVDKPPLTPVPLNDDQTSEWAEAFFALPPSPETPVEFLDFATAMRHDGNFYSVSNQLNDRFSLRFVWPAGRFTDLELPLAVSYWQKIGAGDFSADELKREWFRLGVRLLAGVDGETMTVQLDGLTANFDAALALLQLTIADPTADRAALDTLIEQIRKGRANERKSRDSIADRLWNYGLYGSDTPSSLAVGDARLGAITPAELLAKITALPEYEHEVFYYGPGDPEQVAARVRAILPDEGATRKFPEPRRFTIPEFTADTVYLVNFPTSQLQLSRIVREELFDPNLVAFQDLFNTYVYRLAYQELREARALAYIAGSYIAKPGRQGQYAAGLTRIDVQRDKAVEALAAMAEFAASVPRQEALFELDKARLITSLSSQRVVKEGIFGVFEANRRRGVDYDLRRTELEQLPGISLDDFIGYCRRHLGDRPAHWLVFGDLDGIDREIFAPYGEVVELSVEELFPADY